MNSKQPRRIALLAVAALPVILAALLPAAAAGATIVKDNNTSNLNLPASWVGGVVPGTNDIAQWDGTAVGASLTNLLGADLSWAGIRIVNPSGLVQVNTGNTLTLGANGVDMSSATYGLTLACAVVVAADQLWNAGTKQFSPWGPVNMGGHTVVAANTKVQFKNTIYRRRHAGGRQSANPAERRHDRVEHGRHDDSGRSARFRHFLRCRNPAPDAERHPCRRHALGLRQLRRQTRLTPSPGP